MLASELRTQHGLANLAVNMTIMLADLCIKFIERLRLLIVAAGEVHAYAERSAHRWRPSLWRQIVRARSWAAIRCSAWFGILAVSSVRRVAARTVQIPGIMACVTGGKLKLSWPLSYEKYGGCQEAETGWDGCADHPN